MCLRHSVNSGSPRAIDQRDRLAPGFRQFNVSPEDFDRLMELIVKARTAFMQRGQSMHQMFAQRRREMPGEDTITITGRTQWQRKPIF